MGELLTHEAIVEKFGELNAQGRQIAAKLNDLEAEATEHGAVIKALEQLDPERKCFRQVGTVLVERNVAEVLPAVANNKEQIETLIGRFKEQLQAKQKEVSEFQTKYKIRVRSQGDQAAEQPEATDQGNKNQGVLV